MHKLIMPLWKAKLEQVQALIPLKESLLAALTELGARDAAAKELAWLQGQAQWLEETINGILSSLRAASAQYALGEEGGDEEIIAPIEERVAALLDAIEETENHLRGLGFEPNRLNGAKGFVRIEAIADGAEAVIGSRDEGRRRFEIMARQVFVRFKALVTDQTAHVFALRHDNLEAIYKKLQERRDTADVTESLVLSARRLSLTAWRRKSA